MKKFAPCTFGLALILPLLLASCGKAPEESALPPQSPEKLVVPARGAYTGAYVDFGEDEDEVTLDDIEDFEKLVGKHQAIISSASYWGEQTFPTDNVDLIEKHGSIPLVYWSPWDKPYDEGSAPDRFSLESIIDGKWDSYIDEWADAAKKFGRPLFVVFAKEPNGQTFPWTGGFNGGDKDVADAVQVHGAYAGASGSGTGQEKVTLSGTGPTLSVSAPSNQYEGPETYKKAYRHVVDRVRAKGASNIIWVFQALNISNPDDDWNSAAQYYPGANYVDWLGLTVCGQQYPDDEWSAFTPLIKGPYEEICKLDPRKPVMIAEWQCGEFPKSGSKSAFIAEAFDAMKKDYPRLKAAIYWSEEWQNEDTPAPGDDKEAKPQSADASPTPTPAQSPSPAPSPSASPASLPDADANISDLRVDSSPESLDAYKKGVSDPFWIDKPEYKPADDK